MLLYPIEGVYNDKPKLVSVIVPLYKSKDVIKDQIDSWKEDVDHEIIYVSDRCPQNSTQAVFQAWNNRSDKSKFQVKILLSHKNRGFGGACNYGAHYALGKYLIFLNADTTVTPGWIKSMIDLFEDQSVGIVGNLQIKDGGRWHGTIDGAGSEWNWDHNNFLHIGRHSLNGKTLKKPMKWNQMPNKNPEEREMVTGCCFAIPNNLYKQVGGFNHHYKIGYWEDSELNLTVRSLGYKVMFQPKSVIYHKLSHSNVANHKFQNLNELFFKNKWVDSHRIDSLVKAPRIIPPTRIARILVTRMEANGDVLVAASVCAALKKKYNAQIYFLTKCPKALKNHPFIDKIVDPIKAQRIIFQYECNLDLAYEMRPETNLLTAYAEAAGVAVGDCELTIGKQQFTTNLEKYIVIHSGLTNWVGRQWFGFNEIAIALRKSGHKIVCVGSENELLVDCDLDLRGKTTIQELADVIEKSELFIGIDSFPFHVAQAVNAPSVVFFGSINPVTRVVRENVTPITAKDLPCLGCHHRQLQPSIVTNKCETQNLDCEKMVTVSHFLKEVNNKLCKNI